MAEYNVTAPDGTKYRVTGPEGASDEEVLSQIKSYSAPKPKAAAPAPSSPEGEDSISGFIGGNINKGLAGIAGGALDLGSNIGNLLTAAFGAAQDTSAPGPYSRAIGGKQYTPPSLPFSMPGAGQQLLEKGLQKGGMIPPSAEPTSAPGKYGAAALQALPSAMFARPTPAQIPRALTGAATSGVGAQAGSDIAPPGWEGLGSLLGSLLPGGPKKMATEPSAGERATAGRQAERFGQAKELGIPVPPREMKPDPAQQKIQDAVNRELKLPEGTDPNARTLGGYRAQLYADAWEPIIKEPSLQGKIIATGPIGSVFRREIQDIAKEERRLRGEFKGSTTKPPNQQLAISDFTKPEFTPQGAMEKIHQMRESANNNLGNPSADDATKRLGRMQRKIADAMENLVEKNLTEVGKGDMATKFKESRVKMAQAHTIQGALDPVTGKINPYRLAALYTEGAPLSGELEKIAKTTQAFPRATKPPQESDDVFTKRVTPMAALHPVAAGTHLASRLGSPITMSPPWQSTMVDPRAKLSPEQERIMRILIGAQMGGKQQPPQ